MRHLSLFFACSVILGLALTSASMADDTHGVGQWDFVGLWQAIDSLDGSTQLLSISCARDKSCDVRLNDTAFTLSCDNQIDFAHGVGSTERNVLTVELTL